MIVLAALLALALAAALAPPAQAAKVDTYSFEEGDEDDFRPDIFTVGVVRFRALPRERNRVTARQFDDRVLIVDAGAPLSVGKGCRRRTRHSALCAARDSDQDVYSFRLTSGDDRFDWQGINGPSGELDVDGGPGEDRISGSSAPDTLAGGAGDDRLDGRGRNDLLLGGQGDDRLAGGKGADDLDGGTGRDRLLGGSGNDVLRADDGTRRVGSDRVDGGTGSRDVVSYGRRRVGVVASLASRSGGSPGERDRYADVEWLTGSLGDDVLTGDGRANVLAPLSGEDRVDARGGDDRIETPYTSPVDITCGAGADAVTNPSAGLLVRPDCELLGTTVRAQPASVTADAVVFDLPCASGPPTSNRLVRLSLPAAGPSWAAPGPYDTVLATATRPDGSESARCATTLTFTPEGKAAIGARRSLPVTISGYYAWSFVLTLP